MLFFLENATNPKTASEDVTGMFFFVKLVDATVF